MACGSSSSITFAYLIEIPVVMSTVSSLYPPTVHHHQIHRQDCLAIYTTLSQHFLWILLSNVRWVISSTVNHVLFTLYYCAIPLTVNYWSFYCLVFTLWLLVAEWACGLSSQLLLHFFSIPNWKFLLFCYYVNCQPGYLCYFSTAFPLNIVIQCTLGC